MEQAISIFNGSQVGIEYTLVVGDNIVADSNVGDEPLYFTQGDGEIFPTLEQALLGMRIGDTKTVEVNASNAFGLVNPDAFEKIPKELIPENSRKVGAVLVTNPNHDLLERVRVHEVTKEHIILDFNHPLAGQDLIIIVKILSIL